MHSVHSSGQENPASEVRPALVPRGDGQRQRHRGQRGHFPVQAVGQKESVENRHGDRLAKDDAHCNDLVSLVVLAHDRNTRKNWVAQKPQDAAFGKGDVELPLQGAPLHRDDLVEAAAQGQRQADPQNDEKDPC